MQLEFDLGEPEWVPVHTPYGVTLPNLLAQKRCRDCGLRMEKLPWVRCCGGTDRIGHFSVCDDCASLDGCLTRESKHEGMHVSHWGDWHTADAHDGMVRARDKRRAKALPEIAEYARLIEQRTKEYDHDHE